MFEGLREAVERDPERDESLQRFRPALARSVEIIDCGQPVLAMRVDASKENAVLEDRVHAQDRAVELDRLATRVDPKEARDSAPAKQAQRLRHQLRVAGRLDHEIELPEV